MNCQEFARGSESCMMDAFHPPRESAMWFDELLDRKFQRLATIGRADPSSIRMSVEEKARARRKQSLRLQVRALATGSPWLKRR